jgi:hypothetical protein
MEPAVIRFNLRTTGATSHTQPLTLRVDITENTSRTNYRAQGERMGAMLLKALPGVTLIALAETLNKYIHTYTGGE